MQFSYLNRAAACALLLLAGFVLTPRPARADISVEGGAMVSGGTTTVGAAVSLGLLGVPLVPLSAELTVAAPFTGGYVATVDGRFSYSGTAVGAGVGFGTIGARNRTGVIYDALLAHTIAPHTALEARLYFGPSRPSTLFAGLRFSL